MEETWELDAKVMGWGMRDIKCKSAAKRTPLVGCHAVMKASDCGGICGDIHSDPLTGSPFM